MSGILCAHFGGGAAELVLNISNTATPNIGSLLSAAGWDNVTPVRLVVDPGAAVNTLVIPAISFPGGVNLYVGAGAFVGGLGAKRFGGGGDAFTTNVPISIENYGSFKGGGGNGGGGGSATVRRFDSTSNAFGGSGGQGQGFANSTTLAIQYLEYGFAGQTLVNTRASPGEWIVGDSGSATAQGGYGGNGGEWRSSGSSGSAGSYSGSYSSASAQPGSPGGSAGLNVRNIELVTWIVRGDA